MNLWEGLATLSELEREDLEKIKKKIEKLENEISNIEKLENEISNFEELLKNIHFTDKEIKLLKKIMKEIQFMIEKHILNFELIKNKRITTTCLEDILRIYRPTNIETKLKLLFSNCMIF
jgi:wobble nucleotide-excising tRNase